MLFVYLKIDFLFLLIGDGAAGRERYRGLEDIDVGQLARRE